MSFTLSIACSVYARSVRFYTDVLGFAAIRFEPDHKRAELERDGTWIEISEGGEGLEYPFGRGVTLVIWTPDAEAAYSGVQAYGARLHRPMETLYRDEDGARIAYAAFEVMDPDGYKLRFIQAIVPLGRR